MKTQEQPTMKNASIIASLLALAVTSFAATGCGEDASDSGNENESSPR